ncbi:polyketide cyclase [Oceanobacillus arenosus]|uniref:Polyketide cyclase n=1 Tax=Oceanobacillus arenosus TaxID=1229153 RepID=A0A3D8PKN9_9BACI|nr:ester cyclase [Oceanobacillus arenosus]RDW16047.1 polyketide cyclase [Oceanobacillus arenosus]
MDRKRRFDRDVAIDERNQSIELTGETSLTKSPSSIQDNEQIVKKFFEVVRSGNKPEQAEKFMAKEVKAHQMNSERMVTIIRSPMNYAEHIKEMLDVWGNFKIEIQELLSQNQKVYVRWKQIGKHIAGYEGYPPTNKEVIEIGSAVYQLENQKIVEYWIQVDRLGVIEQIKRNQK